MGVSIIWTFMMIAIYKLLGRAMVEGITAWQGDVQGGFPARNCAIVVKLIALKINRLIRRRWKVYSLPFVLEEIFFFFFQI